MKLQSILVIFAVFALQVNANNKKNADPFTAFINLEIEKLELERELFGEVTNYEILSIASIDVYELQEEVHLGFDSADFLPVDFNAKSGMNEIDWNKFELIELEEEFELGFDTEAYLPEGFNPYTGMICENGAAVSANYKNQ